MSSALSTSSRLTADPTVPYPRSATGTSTDAMNLVRRRLHERTKLAPDVLERLVGGVRAHAPKLALAGVHLGDPLTGERPVPDLAEDVAHPRADVVVDDDGAARVVAVLRRVGDRVAHVREPALPHEVDDQLEL